MLFDLGELNKTCMRIGMLFNNYLDNVTTIISIIYVTEEEVKRGKNSWCLWLLSNKSNKCGSQVHLLPIWKR